MKLKDYVPVVEKMNEGLLSLSDMIGQGNELIKSGTRIKAAREGIEMLYIDFLRQAYAYRRQMLQDLYLIAFDNTEIRTAVMHVTNEVFRKGFDEWAPKFASKCPKCGKEFDELTEYCDDCFEYDTKYAMRTKRVTDPNTGVTKLVKVPKKRKVIKRDEDGKKIGVKTIEPNPAQYEAFDDWRKQANTFHQSLEEVLRASHFDLNIADDLFIWLNKEYLVQDSGDVRERVVEARRIHPAVIEFDLNKEGLPEANHWICINHRDTPYDEGGVCHVQDPKTGEECGLELQPVMYVWNHRGKKLYLLETEIIHISKFSPSETYGYSPLLTILQKVLTLSGMDRFLYRYFFERKAPAGMILTYTDDPESLEDERVRVEAKTQEDPTYMPWVAVSTKSGRGRTDFVRLFHTLQEMDYLPVRNEIRERISALYGVSPIWMGAPEEMGGISTQTQQLVVTSRTVESDQRLYNEKILPKILEAFGITDWGLNLEQPEEKVEAVVVQQAQGKVQLAGMMAQMGFKVELKPGCEDIDTLDFQFSGEAMNMQDMMGGMGGMMGGASMGSSPVGMSADNAGEEKLPGEEASFKNYDLDTSLAPKAEEKVHGMQKRLPGI
jgi:hypothetical protein